MAVWNEILAFALFIGSRLDADEIAM